MMITNVIINCNAGEITKTVSGMLCTRQTVNTRSQNQLSSSNNIAISAMVNKCLNHSHIIINIQQCLKCALHCGSTLKTKTDQDISLKLSSAAYH